MPQQLIYTSAPRGIVAGRSGHCTVARSALMREALMLQLEKFCYYQHLSLSGGQERPIFSCRIVDIRGTRFHVLSRIQDAGLDFTGRTNFIAHHLVFTPEEIRQFPTPPVILLDWPGWVKSWTKEPQLLENEDWADLTALAGKTNVPAQTWQWVTGDAVNGYGLLESRAGASFRVDDQADDTVLQLIAESLELLEVRDTRRDFRTAAWNFTFTTSMQEQDNPADFRWRCIHSDNPAANRFATPDCRALSAVRHANQYNDEQHRFANEGWMPTRELKIEASTQSIQEGDRVTIKAKADGVPYPKYQWYELDVISKQPQPLEHATESKLDVIPARGKRTYGIQVFNQANEKLGVQYPSCEIIIEVREKPKIAQGRTFDSAKKVDPREKQLQSLQAAPHAYRKKLEDFSDGFFSHLFGIPWRNPALAQLEEIKNGLNEDVAKLKEILGQLPGEIQELVEDCRGILDDESKKARFRHFFAATTQIILFLAIVAGLIIFVPHIKIFHRTDRHTTTNTSAADSVALQSQTNIATTAAAPSPQTNQLSNSSSSNLPSAPEKVSHKDDIEQLPSPWSQTPIGNANGNAVLNGSSIILTATGENIYGKSDNFFFVHQGASNDVDFVARLSTTDNEVKSRHGIMMRESEKTDAPFAFIGLSKMNIFFLQRSAAGMNCTFTNLPVTQLPVFFKLNRKTNTFSGAFSIDGKNWTTVGTSEIPMLKQNYLVGLAVCSGSDKAVHPKFDNISYNITKP